MNDVPLGWQFEMILYVLNNFFFAPYCCTISISHLWWIYSWETIEVCIVQVRKTFSKWFSVMIFSTQTSYRFTLLIVFKWQDIVHLGIPKTSDSPLALCCSFFDRVPHITFSLQWEDWPGRGSYEKLKFLSQNPLKNFRYVRSKRAPSLYI